MMASPSGPTNLGKPWYLEINKCFVPFHTPRNFPITWRKTRYSKTIHLYIYIYICLFIYIFLAWCESVVALELEEVIFLLVYWWKRSLGGILFATDKNIAAERVLLVQSQCGSNCLAINSLSRMQQVVSLFWTWWGRRIKPYSWEQRWKIGSGFCPRNEPHTSWWNIEISRMQRMDTLAHTTVHLKRWKLSRTGTFDCKTCCALYLYGYQIEGV